MKTIEVSDKLYEELDLLATGYRENLETLVECIHSYWVDNHREEE